MARTIEEVATAAAARVPDGAVSFGMMEVISIFTAVIPQIVSCFMNDDEKKRTPDEVQAAVRSENDKNPRRLHRRTRNRIFRSATKPVTRAEADVLATAMIAEAVEADDVASFCRHVGVAA